MNRKRLFRLTVLTILNLSLVVVVIATNEGKTVVELTDKMRALVAAADAGGTPQNLNKNAVNIEVLETDQLTNAVRIRQLDQDGNPIGEKTQIIPQQELALAAGPIGIGSAGAAGTLYGAGEGVLIDAGKSASNSVEESRAEQNFEMGETTHFGNGADSCKQTDKIRDAKPEPVKLNVQGVKLRADYNPDDILNSVRPFTDSETQSSPGRNPQDDLNTQAATAAQNKIEEIATVQEIIQNDLAPSLKSANPLNSISPDEDQSTFNLARREVLNTGRTPASNQSVGVLPEQNLRQLLQLTGPSNIAHRNEQGRELVSLAKDAIKKVEKRAQKDEVLLDRLISNESREKAIQRFENAKEYVAQTRSLLESGTDGDFDPSEKKRFRNVFRDLEVLINAGKKRVEESPEQGFKSQDVFNDLLGKQSALTSSTGSDALLRRTLKFAALSGKEKKTTKKKMGLVDDLRLRNKGGKFRNITLIHNGYLLKYGGSKNSFTCSSFISKILPADVRKGTFTTLDFFAIWRLLKTGKVPRPPKWKNKREKKILDTSRGFVALDLYKGDNLVPGDLLLFRVPWLPIGHIFLIEDYNPKTKMARVIEAAQSAGGLRERNYSLSSRPPGEPVTGIRPGLMALRLKPQNNTSCSYERAPSAQKKKTESAPKVDGFAI